MQGAAGAVFPLAFGIIRDEFPRDRVATGIGLISATFGIGGGAGLILSGLIVDNLSYRWIFWFGLIVVLIAVVATRLWVPESPIKSPARVDYGGAALLSAGLTAFLVAVSEGNRWGWLSRADNRPVRRRPRCCSWSGCSTSSACRSRSWTSTFSGCAACGPPTSRPS